MKTLAVTLFGRPLLSIDVGETGWEVEAEPEDEEVELCTELCELTRLRAPVAEAEE